MKKFIAIAAALVLFGTQAFAQLSFGAGYLNSTETTKTTYKLDGSTSSSSQDLNGFYAGANYTIGLDGIVDGLAVTPGVFASMLFGANKDNNNVKYQDLGLNIPLNISYAYELTNDFKLFAFLGPIFQIGLINKTITKDSNSETKVNNFENDIIANTIIKYGRERFNILLGGGLGFEVSEQFQVMVGYNHSLMNYWDQNTPFYNTKVSRSQITVGVGYNF